VSILFASVRGNDRSIDRSIGKLVAPGETSTRVSFQIRNRDLRFNIPQYADDGDRALQSAPCHLLRPRSVERVLYDCLRPGGDRQDNRSTLPLLHGAVEFV